MICTVPHASPTTATLSAMFSLPRLPLPRLRWAATGMGVLALLLRVVHALWWAPRHRGQILISQVLPLVGICALVFGVWLVLVWPHRRRPRELAATGTAFTAPASPNTAAMAIMLAYLSGNFASLLTDADDSLTGDRATWLLATASAAPFLLCGALYLWRGSRVVLSGTELTVRGLRTRHIPWTALLPGGPDVPRGSEHELWLSTTTDHGAHRWQPLSLQHLHVDGALLARTIRHYAEHPEHRAAIGTSTELDRLTTALATTEGGPTDADTGLRDLAVRA